MATSTATLPFSLMMEQERKGANGFTVCQAITEFIDNGYDAGSTSYNIAVVLTAAKMYLVCYDEGRGAPNLLQLYSLGNNIRRKVGTSLGLKNYGHRAAVGRLAPRTVTHVTRAIGAARASTLVLSLGDLYDAIDAAKRAGDCNYSRLDEQLNGTVIRHAPNGGLNDEIRDLLTDVLGGMTANHAAASAFLHKVTAGTVPSYHMMIMEFPLSEEPLIAELQDDILSYRLTYYHALRAGKSICLMTPDTSCSLTAEDAVDPLGAAPRIRGGIEFRTAAGNTYVQLMVEGRSIWYTYRPGDRLYYDARRRLPTNSVSATKPAEWDAATSMAYLDLAASVPSATEENAMKAAVGSSVYKSVNDMRGIYQRFHDRYLGPPIYNDVNWDARRNVGALRVELVARDSESAEGVLGIQTKKSSGSFDAMAPALQFVMNWFCQRVIIAKYSNYSLHQMGKGNHPGVMGWKLEYFWQLLLDQKAEAAAAPAPAPAAAESESESDTASVEPTPAPVLPAKIPVAPSLRSASISLRHMLTILDAELKWYANSNLTELIQEASDKAEKGLAGHLKSLREVRSYLEACGLKQKD